MSNHVSKPRCLKSRARIPIFAALAVAVLSSFPAAARAAEGLRFAAALDQEPAFTLDERGSGGLDLRTFGFREIKTGSVLVVYDPFKAALAAQVADVLEAMNLDARRIVGPALRIHGLVLAGTSGDGPPSLRAGKWVSIDGVNSLVMSTDENSLPFQDEFLNYMIFPLLEHENVDEGIKAECLGGRLTQKSASSRWVVEGIADFTAYQSTLKHQPNALRLFKSHYVDALDRISSPSFDLADALLWWPPGGSGNPSEVAHAYAAAHFAVWELSKTSGPGWIAPALQDLAASGLGLDAASSDFTRFAAPRAGRDVESLIHAIPVQSVRSFAGALYAP